MRLDPALIALYKDGRSLGALTQPSFRDTTLGMLCAKMWAPGGAWRGSNDLDFLKGRNRRRWGGVVDSMWDFCMVGAGSIPEVSAEPPFLIAPIFSVIRI